MLYKLFKYPRDKARLYLRRFFSQLSAILRPSCYNLSHCGSQSDETFGRKGCLTNTLLILRQIFDRSGCRVCRCSTMSIDLRMLNRDSSPKWRDDDDDDDGKDDDGSGTRGAHLGTHVFVCVCVCGWAKRQMDDGEERRIKPNRANMKDQITKEHTARGYAMVVYNKNEKLWLQLKWAITHDALKTK